MTGREIWRKATLFWGTFFWRPFGVNFAMGVATGIVMEFQFGMNCSYYSHYVGDVFGAPLAIEGLIAFFLTATFVGPFFFDWGATEQDGASGRHLVDRSGRQFLSTADPGRQWMDAEPGRRQIQSRYHAHESHRLHGYHFQPGGLGQIRAYRQRQLCRRFGLYLCHFRPVPVAEQAYRAGQAAPWSWLPALAWPRPCR